MKKLFTILTIFIACAASVSAQQTVFIGDTGYDSLDDAITAINGGTASGDITLRAGQTLAGRALVNKNMVIKGDGENITITRNFENALFFGTSGGNLTLENIILNCNDKKNNKAEIEAGNNHVTMTNVKITGRNGTATDNQTNASLIHAKPGRNLNLTNVTYEGEKKESTDGFDYYAVMLRHEIKNGTASNAKLNISGNYNIDIITEAPGNTITAKGLTATSPIEITLGYTPENGQTIVSGTADTGMFRLTDQGYFLIPDGGNLVLTDTDPSTGIEDILAGEENAIVNVYNLQGMLIKANVTRENATAGLAKGIYIIGGKKVAVH